MSSIKQRVNKIEEIIRPKRQREAVMVTYPPYGKDSAKALKQHLSTHPEDRGYRC
ncbi:hypothetical protein [Rickettsiales endosymbiont of Stachyamoeba lipophora]|uniref:hypothetical protein n=1 Tax=Rickettsiales endosymbiont of Stachyamoeba lipophora TaxID=2486578 RepID=UPI0013DE02C6|nr:hypothetical protein [Rickettsiales endosymbiont of Stachyamoeba lipophora]